MPEYLFYDGDPLADEYTEERGLIRDHLYDAGFPRKDTLGCIASNERDRTCGKPLSKHALSEYGDGEEEQGWPISRPPGDMHEPPPYVGELDWHNDGSELLHPFYD